MDAPGLPALLSTPSTHPRSHNFIPSLAQRPRRLQALAPSFLAAHLLLGLNRAQPHGDRGEPAGSRDLARPRVRPEEGAQAPCLLLCWSVGGFSFCCLLCLSVPGWVWEWEGGSAACFFRHSLFLCPSVQ